MGCTLGLLLQKQNAGFWDNNEKLEVADESRKAACAHAIIAAYSTPREHVALIWSVLGNESMSRLAAKRPDNAAVSSVSGSPSKQATLYRHLVFNGSVPLSFSIAKSSLRPGADLSLDNYYVQAWRNTYLAILLPAIRKGLIEMVLNESDAADARDEDCWFTVDNKPLRWHWPIGLIYDYITSARGNYEEPLSVQLHLKSPPESLGLNSSIETCRATFMNRLKEADYVRWGNVRKVTGLRKQDQDALWDGVFEHDMDKFESIANKLLPSLSNTSENVQSARSIPLRIHLPLNIPALQTLVPPAISGVPQTLANALSTLIPNLYPAPSLITDLSASMLITRPTPPLVKKAIVQGISVPFETELGWLANCLCGADGWIDVVIVL